MRKQFTIIKKRAWLCLDKTSLRKTGNGLGLVYRLWFVYAGSLLNDGACRGLDSVNLLVETMPSNAAILVFSLFSIANFNNFTTSNSFPRLNLTLTLLTAHSSVQSLSHVRLFATPWTLARQAFLSITNSHNCMQPASNSQNKCLAYEFLKINFFSITETQFLNLFKCNSSLYSMNAMYSYTKRLF